MPLVVYFVSGKLFVRGIAAGAVKGIARMASITVKGPPDPQGR